MEIIIPVAKANESLTVNIGELLADTGHDERAIIESAIARSPAIMYVIHYGLRQSVNDACAAAKAGDPGAIGLAQKKLAAIVSGSIGTRGPRESADPVGAIMRREARAEITTAARARGIKLPKAGDPAWDKAIGEYIAAHGARLREAAEAEIAKRRETAAAIDLGALFGSSNTTPGGATCQGFFFVQR